MWNSAFEWFLFIFTTYINHFFISFLHTLKALQYEVFSVKKLLPLQWVQYSYAFLIEEDSRLTGEMFWLVTKPESLEANMGLETRRNVPFYLLLDKAWIGFRYTVICNTLWSNNNQSQLSGILNNSIFVLTWGDSNGKWQRHWSKAVQFANKIGYWDSQMCIAVCLTTMNRLQMNMVFQ